MSDEIEFDAESSATTWAAFGDLMSVLLGAFVLILASVIGIQLLLHNRLDEEVKQRQAEAARLAAGARWQRERPPLKRVGLTETALALWVAAWLAAALRAVAAGA